jgi:hypothetical protein
VDLSRRGFLGALAAAPLGRALFGPPFLGSRAPSICALPESRAGFAKALAGRETPDVLVFPGAAGWDDSIARQVRGGRLVIFESAAGFAEPSALREQGAGLRAAFGLALEPPVTLWTAGRRPSYVDLLWPVRARIRDFSFAVPVHGGEAIGRLGRLPVAALRRAGAGALLFLGSPVGPALWSDDPEAHAWLSSVIAHPPTSVVRNRWQAGAREPATPAVPSGTMTAVNRSIV